MSKVGVNNKENIEFPQRDDFNEIKWKNKFDFRYYSFELIENL